MEAFLLINKPEGWTSFDVVAFLRNKLKRNISAKGGQASGLKVGHAGTLDPFATGLLIVGVGRQATKRLEEFKNLPKTYEAIIHLGKTSDTDDKTGKLEKISDQIPGPEKVEKTIRSFWGKQKQTPPMFSAKKIAGQRLYKLARQGKTVDRVPEEIEIHSIKILDYSYPKLKIEVTCSPGTYIRTLARDIGTGLGTGAYCEELTRTAIGKFLLKDALSPEETNLDSKT